MIEYSNHLTGRIGEDGSITDKEWIGTWIKFVAAKTRADARKARGHGKDE